MSHHITGYQQGLVFSHSIIASCTLQEEYFLLTLPFSACWLDTAYVAKVTIYKHFMHLRSIMKLT